MDFERLFFLVSRFISYNSLSIRYTENSKSIFFERIAVEGNG